MLNSIKTFTRQNYFISVLKYLDTTFGAVKTVFQSDPKSGFNVSGEKKERKEVRHKTKLSFSFLCFVAIKSFNEKLPFCLNP